MSDEQNTVKAPERLTKQVCPDGFIDCRAHPASSLREVEYVRVDLATVAQPPDTCLDVLLQPQIRETPEGEEPELVKCEVFDCNEHQTCFHYCREHHNAICKPTPPTVVVAQPPIAEGISWTVLLGVLERLRSKNRNPDNEWYHGWNAAIQCLINDVNARAKSPAASLQPPSPQSQSWVVHIVGPDDVIPKSGELDALRSANEVNAAIERDRRRHANDPNYPFSIAIAKQQ